MSSILLTWVTSVFSATLIFAGTGSAPTLISTRWWALLNPKAMRWRCTKVFLVQNKRLSWIKSNAFISVPNLNWRHECCMWQSKFLHMAQRWFENTAEHFHKFLSASSFSYLTARTSYFLEKSNLAYRSGVTTCLVCVWRCNSSSFSLWKALSSLHLALSIMEDVFLKSSLSFAFLASSHLARVLDKNSSGKSSAWVGILHC